MSNSSQKPPYAVKLPSDVLLRIFSQLPQTSLFTAARVCKDWHQVTLSPQLWTRVDQDVMEKWYGLKRLRTVNDFYRFLEDPRFQRLEHLAFPRALAFGEFNQRRFITWGVHHSKTYNTRGLVERLQSHCRYINTVLVLDSDNKQPSQGDGRVLRRFDSIGGSDIFNFSHISNLTRVVAPVTLPMVEFVTSIGTQLTDLRFMYEPYEHSTPVVENLAQIADHCPNLQVLCIALKPGRYYRRYFTMAHWQKYHAAVESSNYRALVQVINQCTHLRRLSLVNAENSGLIFSHIYERRRHNELLNLEQLECGYKEVHFMGQEVYEGLLNMRLLVVHPDSASVNANVFFGRF